jgi:hypothetical protein
VKEVCAEKPSQRKEEVIIQSSEVLKRVANSTRNVRGMRGVLGNVAEVCIE